MKIIIVGAGDVGSHLAKLLSNEEQDILVIDQNSAKIDILDANYNLMTMAGSPTTFKTLREAGVDVRVYPSLANGVREANAHLQ